MTRNCPDACKQRRDAKAETEALPRAIEVQQEKRLAELARREKMRKFNDEQAAKAREDREIMMARIEKAAQDRKDEQIRLMEERQAIQDARRTEMVKKRAEMEKRRQEDRLRKMEEMRRASEELAAAKLRKEEANQASYERWKAAKQAQKEEEARKRKIRRQQEHEANVKLLQDLQSRLKDKIKRPAEVSKIPTPPPFDSDTEHGHFSRSYARRTPEIQRRGTTQRRRRKKTQHNARYSPRADMERFFPKAPSGALDGLRASVLLG